MAEKLQTVVETENTSVNIPRLAGKLSHMD